MISRKKRRSNQSSIASRFLRVAERLERQSQQQDAAALSPVSRRSKGSLAGRSTKTAKTEPTLVDQSTSGSCSWTETTPTRSALSTSLEHSSPDEGDIPLTSKTKKPNALLRTSFRLFPTTSPERNVVVQAAQLDCSDHSSLSRTSGSDDDEDQQRAPRNRRSYKKEDKQRNASSSFVESEDEEEPPSLKQTQAGGTSSSQQALSASPLVDALKMSAVEQSIDSLKFLFDANKWTTCDESFVFDNEEDDEQILLTGTQSDVRSDFTGASTQIATNRQIDITMRRLRHFERHASDGESPARQPKHRVAHPQNHPVRYSFGHTSAQVNPAQLEAKSVLSISSTDGSSSRASSARYSVERGALLVNQSSSTEEEEPLPPVAGPVGRLGNFVQKKSNAALPPRDASIHSKSMASSVGAEINLMQANNRLRNIKATFQNKRVPASGESVDGQDSHHVLQQDSSVFIPQLLTPDSSTTSSKKRKASTPLEANMVADADLCASPPEIVRRTVSDSALASPDPIFCPHPSPNCSVSQMSSALSGRFGGSVATSSVFSPEESDASQTSERATISVGGMDVESSVPVLRRTAPGPTNSPVFAPRVPSFAKSTPSQRVSAVHDSSPDSLFHFGASPIEQHLSGDSSDAQKQRCCTVLPEGSLVKETVRDAGGIVQGACRTIPACAPKNPSSSISQRSDENDKIMMPILSPQRTRNEKAGQESKPFLHRQWGPARTGTVLAAVSKFEQPASFNSSRQRDFDLEEEKTAFGKNESAGDMCTGSTLHGLFSRHNSVRKCTDMDHLTVSIQSIRSAFESVESPDCDSEDESDDYSVKERADRFEQANKMKVPTESAVSRMRAMFESKIHKPPNCGSLRDTISMFDSASSKAPVSTRRNNGRPEVKKAPVARETASKGVVDDELPRRLGGMTVAERIRAFNGNSQPTPVPSSSRSIGSNKTPRFGAQAVNTKGFQTGYAFKRRLGALPSVSKPRPAPPKPKTEVVDSQRDVCDRTEDKPRANDGEIVVEKETTPHASIKCIEIEQEQIVSDSRPMIVKPLAKKAGVTEPVRPHFPVESRHVQPKEDTEMNEAPKAVPLTRPIMPNFGLRERIAMFSRRGQENDHRQARPSPVSFQAGSLQPSAGQKRDARESDIDTHQRSPVPDDQHVQPDQNPPAPALFRHETSSKTITNVQTFDGIELGPSLSRLGAVKGSAATDEQLAGKPPLETKPPSTPERVRAQAESLRSSTPRLHTSSDRSSSTGDDSEFSDGVTLDLSIAEVSNLTTPTALISKAGDRSVTTEAYGSEHDHNSKASEYILEAEAKRSEASSSHTSEAQIPLLAKAMRSQPMSDEMSANSVLAAKRLFSASHGDTPPEPVRSEESKSRKDAFGLDSFYPCNDDFSAGWDPAKIESTFPAFNETKTSANNDLFAFDDWEPFDTESTNVFKNSTQPRHVAEPVVPRQQGPSRSEIATNSEPVLPARSPSYGRDSRKAYTAAAAQRRQATLNNAATAQQSHSLHAGVNPSPAVGHSSNSRPNSRNSNSSSSRESSVFSSLSRHGTPTLSESSRPPLPATSLPDQQRSKPVPSAFSRTNPHRPDPRLRPDGRTRIKASDIERLPVRLPPSQHRPQHLDTKDSLGRIGAQHAALMSRLRELKEARMRRAAAVYERNRSLQREEYDEHSNSTRSSTQFGGSTFMQSLEVD